MSPATKPPDWIVKVVVALLLAAATAWASFVSQRALMVAEVESRLIQSNTQRTAEMEIVNYKLDLLLKAHDIDMPKDHKK